MIPYLMSPKGIRKRLLMSPRGARSRVVKKHMADATPPEDKKQRGVPFTDETYGVLTQLRSIWGLESIDDVVARLIEENELASRARDLRREAQRKK